MAKAGYNPEKAVTFWRHANEVFGGNSGGFFSTHPGSADREENLLKALPVAQKYYETGKNSKQLFAKNLQELPFDTESFYAKTNNGISIKKGDSQSTKSEEQLYKELKAGYLRKGIPEQKADEVISSFKQMLANADMETKRESLQSAIDSMK
jgi:hypothetical protein